MAAYKVKQGDCILSIAAAARLPWKTVWNHPENADLRQKRKSPNVLHPGDSVFVPDRQVPVYQKPVDATHKFTVTVEKAQLRLQLLDRNHKPRPNLPYTLVIDGKTVKGTTDSQGNLAHPMAGNAQKAKLTVVDQGVSEEYPLQLGGVDPVTEPSGVRQRLKNLGFSGDNGLRLFQMKYNLPVTGNADQATMDKLSSIHGC